MNDDVLVYDDWGSHHYVALIGDLGWRWPAEQDGWQQRARVRPSYAERCFELPQRNAELALRLSGVSLP